MVAGFGYILGALSAVFNGSFASIFKTEKVAAAKLDPMLFQLYVSAGVFLSSFVVIPFLSYNKELTGKPTAGTALVFEPLGLVAGALFVLAISFSFLAVDCIGVALGQGVWGGIAIVVSYAWGVIAFGNPIASPLLAGLAMILLCIGVVGIAFCEAIGGKFGDSSSPREHFDVAQQHSFEVRTADSDSTEGSGGASKRALGMVYAACVGFCGGSILAPMHYVPDSASGLAFVVSFGIGTMVASPLVAAFAFMLRGNIPDLHFAATFPAGLFSGLLYNIGNVLQIIAIPLISFSIAGPLLQCALFVAGLWGIFIFKEIKGAAIPVFFVSGTVLITGAVCLSLSAGKAPITTTPMPLFMFN